MDQAERPIGIFDSGIGGLTVFQALRRLMPRENLVYFGDTAHLPYGSKSKDAVAHCSVEVSRYLARREIKALVVACNTASALALPEVEAAVKVPVIGVIHPGARAAAAASRSLSVGIIGTEATIASEAYSRALRGYLPGVKITAKACPLFVPLVEEGWWSHPVTKTVAREYLAPLRAAKVDSLILGCTHYPLLKKVIGSVMGPSVRLIDSAEQTAIEALELLKSIKSVRRSGKGTVSFVVSDNPVRFGAVAKRLLIPVQKVEVYQF